MIVVLMGVAGAGKTHVGSALAMRLGWQFVDADEHHSAANIAKMRAGIPLSDEDREPWLESLRQLIARFASEGRHCVIACSALRGAFRQRLASAGDEVVFVHLRVSPATAEHRARTRPGHFLPSHLVESQFSALEVPENAIIVDGEAPVDEVVRRIVDEAGLPS